MKRIIDISLLKEMIDGGYIVSQKHPSLDIYLYNYTRKCTYEKMWNEATLNARGLILDGKGNIVSLPLRKFFNYEELTPEARKANCDGKAFKVYHKVDGSCGILWEYEGQYGIATRGSFTSDQAIWATNLLNTKYANALKDLGLNTEKFTFVFEIIYKKNRIVVDYGDFEDIVLLAVINKETGVDEWMSEHTVYELGLYFKIVDSEPKLEHKTIDELKELNLPNKEGFVLHFEDGFRVKVKFADYCRLHSIITNITFRDIWNTLRQNKPLDEILENVPDEFDEWVRKKVAFLNKSFADLKVEIEKRHAAVVADLPVGYTKKWFAMKNLSLNKERFFKGCVFAIEDGKDITADIWNKLYPPHEKPFLNSGDDDIE